MQVMNLIRGTYGFFSHSHGGLLSESHLGVLIRTSTLLKGATVDFAGIVLNMFVQATRNIQVKLQTE
nr:hypothetical protein CFP56_74043 [Quercus suber]